MWVNQENAVFASVARVVTNSDDILSGSAQEALHKKAAPIRGNGTRLKLNQSDSEKAAAKKNRLWAFRSQSSQRHCL